MINIGAGLRVCDHIQRLVRQEIQGRAILLIVAEQPAVKRSIMSLLPLQPPSDRFDA